MKIDHAKPSEHGTFTIEATEGREITDMFRDSTTGLLIVEERVDDRRELTTVDPETGQVVPIDARASRIDYTEKRTFDEETSLELRSLRKVDATTGVETVHETLVKPDGAEVARTTRIAFTRSKLPNLLDDHKRREAESHRFWQEYAAKDFAARAAYWAGTMFRHMRWQTESGLDPCAGFDRAWFEDAKRHEPDFDRMFDHILQRYEQEFLYNDTSPDAIRRRIGR